MSEFKDLNLDREMLDAHVTRFVADNGMTLDGEPAERNNGQVKRYQFGTPGSEFATVDLHLNKTGTTTIQWQIGKNRELGEQLAKHLKATIDPAELENVNYSLAGITTEAIDSILELISDSDEFDVEVRMDTPTRKQVELRSVANHDRLVVTHFPTTRRLQIQGRPLTCYRHLVFLLTDLLDLKGLEKVLYKKEDSSAEIVRKEMAEDYLKSQIESFERFPEVIRKLLLSSCCIKLAAPQLPDYCLLLYPELRAIEGALKDRMRTHGMNVSESENGFGDFFECDRGTCTLRDEYVQSVNANELVVALNEAYSFYRKHRHSLFHMQDFAGASRMIDTLGKAMALSKDAYHLLEALYR